MAKDCLNWRTPSPRAARCIAQDRDFVFSKFCTSEQDHFSGVLGCSPDASTGNPKTSRTVAKGTTPRGAQIIGLKANVKEKDFGWCG